MRIRSIHLVVVVLLGWLLFAQGAFAGWQPSPTNISLSVVGSKNPPVVKAMEIFSEDATARDSDFYTEHGRTYYDRTFREAPFEYGGQTWTTSPAINSGQLLSLDQTGIGETTGEVWKAVIQAKPVGRQTPFTDLWHVNDCSGQFSGGIPDGARNDAELPAVTITWIIQARVAAIEGLCKTAAGVPKSVWVRLFEHGQQQPLQEVQSNDVTGYYSFEFVQPGKIYEVRVQEQTQLVQDAQNPAQENTVYVRNFTVGN